MLTLCAFSSSSRRITATVVIRQSPNLAKIQILHRKVSVELPQSVDLYLDNMNNRSIRKHQNTYHLPRSQHIRERLQSSATLCGDRGTVDHFRNIPANQGQEDLTSDMLILILQVTSARHQRKKPKGPNSQRPLLVIEQEASERFAKLGLIDPSQQ